MKIHRVGLVLATCLSFSVPFQLSPVEDEPRWMSKMSDAQKTSAGLSKLSESERQFLGKYVDDFLKPKSLGSMKMVSVGSFSELEEIGFSPLQKAAKNASNPDAITELLKAGAEIEAKDPNGRTPLMIAASSNPNQAVISTLLKAGAAIEAWDFRGQTPLMLAAGFNPNPDVVLQLLKAGALVEVMSLGGVTPLMHAAQHTQSPEVITHLLKAGAKIDAKSERGVSPMLYAARLNRNPEVIMELLNAGAQIEAKDNKGWTPLMLAADGRSNPEMVEALLKAGAQIEAKDKKGWTPLMIAAMNPHGPIPIAGMNFAFSTGGKQVAEDIIENLTVLLDAGANPRATDADGKTALDYAKENEKFYKVSKAYKELEEAFHDQG